MLRLLIVFVRFLRKRGVLEVETLLSHATVTDAHIMSMAVPFKEMGSEKEDICYLQTSPEYAMKRLLAAGIGSIFQITKAFRQGEVGRLHNPEFTMLEWYRLGFDHHALMDEMDELLHVVLQLSPATRMSAMQVYQQYLEIDPHSVTIEDLKICAEQRIELLPQIQDDKNSWLDLLFTHCIQPHLGQEVPFFLYDFPCVAGGLSLRSVRKIHLLRLVLKCILKGWMYGEWFSCRVARFLLSSVDDFENDLVYRAKNSVPLVCIDERFLAALQHGIPDCAGVALGIDRLMMLALECETDCGCDEFFIF